MAAALRLTRDSFALAHLTPANYNGALDFNNDGRIDIADFGQFSVRFFTTLP